MNQFKRNNLNNEALYKIISASLQDNEGMNNSSFRENADEDDKTFRRKTTKQISARDEQYTELLKHFVEITKNRNESKEKLKKILFITILIIIIALATATCLLYVKYFTSAQISDYMDSFPFSPIAGITSAIIVIPLTITKYLFSTKEDDNITRIILHTQDHDINGREWVKELNKIIKEPEEKENDDTKNDSLKKTLELYKKYMENTYK